MYNRSLEMITRPRRHVRHSHRLELCIVAWLDFCCDEQESLNGQWQEYDVASYGLRDRVQPWASKQASQVSAYERMLRRDSDDGTREGGSTGPGLQGTSQRDHAYGIYRDAPTSALQHAHMPAAMGALVGISE